MAKEIQPLLFKELAADLPDQHQAEFYRALHETGISQNDVELARLLRALQLYKSYYESIPAAVQKAAAEMERIKTDIEGFSRDAHQSSEASAQLAGQVIEETERIHTDLAQIHERIEKGIVQSSENIGPRMAELLSAGIEKTVLVPLQNQLTELAGAGKAFGDAINQSNRAVVVLRENLRLVRRAHIGTYSLCGIVILCSLLSVAWFFLHRWYADQIKQEHTSSDKNRTVLLELAKSHRSLEIIQDPEHPDRKLLVMKDASGWQSIRKYGVIEFGK